ncbi:MAG: hypothetical protein WBG92_12035 [Thiohalocapsa sp.]
MKLSISTIVGASALALALSAPGVRAGFDLSDYVLKPIISAAEILPPAPAEPTDQDEVNGSARIRLSGQFCKHPEVYQGNRAGGFEMLYQESNSANEIYAELLESEPAVTYKIGVTCQLGWLWHVATIDLMVPAEPVEPVEPAPSDI